MTQDSQKFAKPGDIIEVANWNGKQFIVIYPTEPPYKKSRDRDAWVQVESENGPRLILAEFYKIVKIEKRSSQDTDSVDASLEKQRDANLRQVFE